MFETVQNIKFVLTESSKFKTFISDNQEAVFKVDEIIEPNNDLTYFGVEIFYFWLEAIKTNNSDKLAFVECAKNSNIPVIDYDKNDLSNFGEKLFLIWSNAIKITGVKYEN